MVHEYRCNQFTSSSRGFLRAKHPDAAIIRHHGNGGITVFDEVFDAVNHWSAGRPYGGSAPYYVGKENQ